MARRWPVADLWFAQMIVEFGSFALVLALCLSLAQAGLSAVGRWRRSALLAGAGEGSALAAFLAVALAFAALMHAFITSDFSVANVAANSHTEKPLIYKIAGTWGSHEGSMLLWCLALTGFGSAVAGLGRDLPKGLKALTVMTQGALGSVFLAYTVLASNPFVRLYQAPVEGRSLNPLLQDPALAVHPPFLYAGYVGMSVVFSFAVAALIEGRVDAAWARWVRPWTLAAWSMLTMGITMGAFWAYYELGWGGWWFWDPVENASFMPWLIATALLHSAIVTEKRGALSGWTVFLAIAAFTFSMLGAFLVRSGVLTSVHAFAVDPTRGALLLGILAVTAGAAFSLFAWRAPVLAPGGVFPHQPRERPGPEQYPAGCSDHDRADGHALSAHQGGGDRGTDLSRTAIFQPDLHAPDGGADDPFAGRAPAVLETGGRKGVYRAAHRRCGGSRLCGPAGLCPCQSAQGPGERRSGPGRLADRRRLG